MSKLLRALGNRRIGLTVGVLAGGLLVGGVLLVALGRNRAAGSLASTGSRSENRITHENALPGTDAWAKPGTFRLDHLAAYAGAVSVNAGAAVDLFVHATGSTANAQLYRLGYYQNHGARLIATYPNITTTAQPACTRERSTGLVSCLWNRTFTIATDPAWISGIYLIRLDSSDGYMALAYFVVRNDAYAAPIVAQDAAKTNQAYNVFDGESLYHSLNDEGRSHAYKVSFDRPYSTGDGVGTLFTWETDMIRWLEGSGYDVTYISDLDKATDPRILLNHRVFLDIGHDEYWTWSERDNVEAARDAGVNLVFASGNEAYWHARLEESPLGPNRVLVCYKDAKLDPKPLPPDATVTFSDPFLGRPENSLLGVQYHGNPDYGLPPWQVAAPADRWYFDCTTLKPGDVINNIVGYEWDTVRDNGHTPPGLEVLAGGNLTYRGKDYPASTTLYTATSGARVFAAGSIQWAWGVIDHAYANYKFVGGAQTQAADPRIAQLTANILDNFTGAWAGRPRACGATAQGFLAGTVRATPTLVPPQPPPGVTPIGGEPGEPGESTGGSAATRTPPPPAPTRPPALTPCATQVPLSASFESGALDGFRATGSPGWHVVGQPIRAGHYSAFAPVVTAAADQQLVLAQGISIPAGAASATLRFVKRYVFTADEANNFAGAVLELSSDGGATWADAGPRITAGGYTGKISPCCANPLAGRAGWIGVSVPNGTQTLVDLLPYAGQTVLARWRVGPGGGPGGSDTTGIWLDDVTLTIGFRECSQQH
jgi:hypothetical protein